MVYLLLLATGLNQSDFVISKNDLFASENNCRDIVVARLEKLRNETKDQVRLYRLQVRQEEDENEEEKEVDEMTFEERLDYIETTLSKQLELMQKLNRIEHISEQIEADKAKGDVRARIETVEQKKIVYEFNITGFNHFCKSVYSDVKSSSRIKKRSYIIKKVGRMWRTMDDEEKEMYA